MTVSDTSGVTALAKILVRIADGDAPGVVQLAAENGLARSTTFEVIRRLESQHIVTRFTDAKLLPGPAAIALGLAAFGLAPLQGPAEALLILLHEQTGARVELMAGDTVLISRGVERADTSLQAPILDAAGVEKARLRLAWRPMTSRVDQARIAVHFERTRSSLHHYLNRDIA